MFGFKQRNHADFALATFTQALVKINSDLEEERNRTRAIAKEATDLIRKYNKEYKNKKNVKNHLYTMKEIT